MGSFLTGEAGLDKQTLFANVASIQYPPSPGPRLAPLGPSSLSKTGVETRDVVHQVHLISNA